MHSKHDTCCLLRRILTGLLKNCKSPARLISLLAVSIFLRDMNIMRPYSLYMWTLNIAELFCLIISSFLYPPWKQCLNVCMRVKSMNWTDISINGNDLCSRLNHHHSTASFMNGNHHYQLQLSLCQRTCLWNVVIDQESDADASHCWLCKSLKRSTLVFLCHIDVTEQSVTLALA